MIILIDAYNVLKQHYATSTVTQGQVTLFLERLSLYALRKEHSIVVVFDGIRPFDWGEYQVPRVRVVYSGKRTADELIQLQTAHVPPDSLLVVSSDREVAQYAIRARGQAIDSCDFYMLVIAETQASPQHQQPQQGIKKKEGYESSAELDTLMMKECNVIRKPLDDTFSSERIRTSHTLSKREKKMIRIIKKL